MRGTLYAWGCGEQGVLGCRRANPDPDPDSNPDPNPSPSPHPHPHPSPSPSSNQYHGCHALWELACRPDNHRSGFLALGLGLGLGKE